MMTLTGRVTIISMIASHLWQYASRSMDTIGLQDALETAALTASYLYDRVRVASS